MQTKDTNPLAREVRWAMKSAFDSLLDCLLDIVGDIPAIHGISDVDAQMIRETAATLNLVSAALQNRGPDATKSGTDKMAKMFPLKEIKSDFEVLAFEFFNLKGKKVSESAAKIKHILIKYDLHQLNPHTEPTDEEYAKAIGLRSSKPIKSKKAKKAVRKSK
jgi:hypothetical protein